MLKFEYNNKRKGKHKSQKNKGENKMDYQQEKAILKAIGEQTEILKSIETLLAEILLHLNGEQEEEI